MTQKRRLELIWNSKCPKNGVFGAAENLGELQTASLTLLFGVPKVGRAVHLGFIHQRDAEGGLVASRRRGCVIGEGFGQPLATLQVLSFS